MEDGEKFHLAVDTEVSAKYRGAFCEAKIKSVKKQVVFRVSNKEDNKVYSLSEEALKGILKIGSTVEAQFTDAQGWQEGIVLTAKDKSIYTVEFDDGDIRTLTRGSLCLQGVRHYAEGDTLDQLPLTDPENFGTPVLNTKRKAKRKALQSPLDNEDRDSDDQKAVDGELPSKRPYTADKAEVKDDHDEESVDEKRKKWLADPLMAKLVLVEPSDKRKHWYPGLCINPLCLEDPDEVEDGEIIVRSFKTGKINVVSRCERLTKSSTPCRVEAAWKDVLDHAFSWEESGIIPDVWKADIKDILDDEDDEETNEDLDEDDEKNHEFLELLYKFMDDRGTAICKTPVLGYKDLDLFALYNLVQAKGGFYNVTSSTDWREIYTDLGIPKMTPAAGHHVKNAYNKYLLGFEEYMMSFQHAESKTSNQSRSKSIARKSARSSSKGICDESSTRRSSGRRRRMSESMNFTEDNEASSQRESKRTRKSKPDVDTKRESDADDASSTASSEKTATVNKLNTGSTDSKSAKMPGRRRSNSGVGNMLKNTQYKVGEKLRIKYGNGSYKLYNAKVVDVDFDANNEIQYYVHYAGWNSRHDEWIKSWRISGVVNEKDETSSNPTTPKNNLRRPKTPTQLESVNPSDTISPTVQLIQESFSDFAGSLSVTSKTKSTRKEVSDLMEELGSSSKKVEIKKPGKSRIRRRSTSSSTPPPKPDEELSLKRAASLEKCVLEKNVIVKKEVKEEFVPSEEKSSAVKKTSSVPKGFFPTNRRTSGRRSKSPAYLKESALYGLIKRKRNSNSITETTTPNDADHDRDDDISSESSSRSTGSSPSEASSASPVVVWSEADHFSDKLEKPKRKRSRKKSVDNKKSDVEVVKEISLATTKNAAYDSFDDEAPKIELERIREGEKRTAENSLLDAENPEQKQPQQDSDDKKNVSDEKTDAGEEEEEDSNSNETSASSDANATSEQSQSSSTAQQQAIPTTPSSKTMLPNTPPTTPEASPQHYDDEAETSRASGSGSSSGAERAITEETAKDDLLEEERPEKEKRPQQKRQSKGKINHNQKEEKTNEVKNVQDEKCVAESESDEEAQKSRHVKRKKPKKKTRPDLPAPPKPFTQEELAAMTSDERIQFLQDKMAEMRRVYQLLKQEVSSIDRKRKRAKRREQEAAEQSAKKNSASSPTKQSHSEAAAFINDDLTINRSVTS